MKSPKDQAPEKTPSELKETELEQVAGGWIGQDSDGDGIPDPLLTFNLTGVGPQTPPEEVDPRKARRGQGHQNGTF